MNANWNGHFLCSLSHSFFLSFVCLFVCSSACLIVLVFFWCYIIIHTAARICRTLIFTLHFHLVLCLPLSLLSLWRYSPYWMDLTFICAFWCVRPFAIYRCLSMLHTHTHCATVFLLVCTHSMHTIVYVCIPEREQERVWKLSGECW